MNLRVRFPNSFSFWFLFLFWFYFFFFVRRKKTLGTLGRRILINSCLMKNTFANWRSCEKRGKLLPVGHPALHPSHRMPVSPNDLAPWAFLKSILSTFYNQLLQCGVNSIFSHNFMGECACLNGGQPHAHTHSIRPFNQGGQDFLQQSHVHIRVQLSVKWPTPSPTRHCQCQCHCHRQCHCHNQCHTHFPPSSSLPTGTRHPPPTASRLLSVTSELYLPGSHPPAPPYPESAFRVLQSMGLQCQSNLNWKSKSTRLRDIDWLS